MNKSLSVSIGGLSFFIEEDAYIKLYKYINDVKSSLHGEEDVEEIIKDVESRVAELFKQWLGNYRQVIDDKDVKKVIDIMGTPEQYQAETEQNQKTPKQSKRNENFYHKQLFRDIDDKIIGGVCSGISHFFGVQPIWVRFGLIIFIILNSFIFNLGGVFPTIVMTYIVLLIVVPKAVTTSDKLKMKGKPINFGSIKEYINKEELVEQSGNIKQNISKASNELGNVLESLIKVFFKIIAIIFGVICVITGISMLISYFIILFAFYLPGNEQFRYMDIVFESTIQLNIVMILTGITIIIPALFILLLGMRLITEKSIVKVSIMSLIIILLIWLLSIAGLSVLSFNSIASQFLNKTEKKNKYKIETGSDTLNISMSQEPISSSKIYGVNVIKGIKFSKDSLFVKIDNELEIKKSPDSNFYLETRLKSSGKNETEAIKNLSSINYQFTIHNNNVKLQPYLSFPKIIKYRRQNVGLILYVPEGRYFNSTNIKTIINKSNNNLDIYHNKIVNSNNLFKFENSKLDCLTCDGIGGNVQINTGEVKIKTDEDSLQLNFN